MTDDRNPMDDFAAELAGLDIAATFANESNRTDYRKSMPYGLDGTRLDGQPDEGADWFTEAEFDNG